MPFIRFTANPKLPADLAHLRYKQGDVVELSGDQCERWIRRKVAVYTDKPAPPAAVAAVPEPVEAAPPAREPVETLPHRPRFGHNPRRDSKS